MEKRTSLKRAIEIYMEEVYTAIKSTNQVQHTFQKYVVREKYQVFIFFWRADALATQNLFTIV